MPPARHVILFVKAPRRGRAKRRLTADIGAAAAARFYRETVARVAFRLGRDPRWRLRLAVTPDDFAARACFWPGGLKRIPQGRGDLGARMARALASLPAAAGPRLIVGGDIPDIAPRHVAAAFAALRRHDLVFGPAADGGFWLIGSRRAPPAGLFDGVRWSSPHALADTLANLPRGVRAALVDELEDVDNGAAWRRWRTRRGRVSSLSDAPEGGA
ncbi:MAG: TIGR04282 family arsenosugar biosynthesis glycosyltransferase [Alphaproteobacteria bacterium]